MSDAFGEAARLVMAGVVPDRLVQGLTPEMRKALAFHLLNGWEGLPVLPVVKSVQVLIGRTDQRHILVAGCGDSECLTCGSHVCPYGEPLHFHHDGCPACAQQDPPLPSPGDVLEPDPDEPGALATRAEEARAGWRQQARIIAGLDPPPLTPAEVQERLGAARANLEELVRRQDERDAADAAKAQDALDQERLIERIAWTEATRHRRKEPDHPERTSTHAEDR